MRTVATSHQSPSWAPAAQSSRLEQITLFHVAALLVATTWLFGGNAGWVKPYLAAWASISLPLLVLNLREAARYQRDALIPRDNRELSPSHTARFQSPNTRALLLCLCPLIALNALVAVSLFFPGFRTFLFEGETLYISNRVSTWIPSAAYPPAVGITLWLFNGVYLSSFNLLLAPRSRRALRRFFFITLSNALLLAVFGTFQKLGGAKGLFFGLVRSPQERFFASFIYHNHWGALCVLMLALALGLFAHYLRRHLLRDLVRTPAMYVLAVVAATAITTPLSNSRSGTVLVLLCLFIATIHALAIFWKRHDGPPSRRPLPAVFASVVFALLLFVGYDLAKPQITERVRQTQGQFSGATASPIAHRRTLYHDTWHMARDRLAFGWGMASYPHTFPIYNTQSYGKADRLPLMYHDAHNDWLQTLAEFGVVGSALIALCALCPLLAFRNRLRTNPISAYLFGGCLLILLYAWLEFPFGNTAVRLSFWICLFAAIRYAHLTHVEHAAKLRHSPHVR